MLTTSSKGEKNVFTIQQNAQHYSQLKNRNFQKWNFTFYLTDLLIYEAC